MKQRDELAFYPPRGCSTHDNQGHRCKRPATRQIARDGAVFLLCEECFTRENMPNQNSRHTPGPWQFTDDGKVWPTSGRGEARICTCTDGSHKMANAALVSAAPDLLAALQQCLDVFELPEPTPDDYGTCYTATQRSGTIAAAKLKARDAIAKATWFEHPHWL